MTTRKRIYQIIEHRSAGDIWSKAYDIVMMGAIAIAILPLMFREQYPIFHLFEVLACGLFVIDYILQWVTADFKSTRTGAKPFLIYPLTIGAIIDLITILPGLNLINKGFMALRVVRVFRAFRIFKTLHYSNKIQLLLTVLRKESKVLISVLFLAIFYIFTTALIMFNAENSFDDFFDSLYWATTALTTVGYGDICPTTDIGRLISMLSSLFGVAIIALPSGIITAGYMTEMKQDNPRSQE